MYQALVCTCKSSQWPLQGTRFASTSAMKLDSEVYKPLILSRRKPMSYRQAREPRALAQANHERIAEDFFRDRIRKTASNGNRGLLEALILIKSKPTSKVHASAWDSLVSAAIEQKRVSFANKVILEMKRRGCPPTQNTFATYFSTLVKLNVAEVSEDEVRQFVNHATQIHNYWRDHLARLKAVKTEDDRISVPTLPTNAYMTFLLKLKQFSKVLEIFNGLPSVGLGSPDVITYTLCFRVLAQAQSPDVSDAAKKLWTTLSQNQTLTKTLDSEAISAISDALIGTGDPASVELALFVLAQYYRLRLPTRQSSPESQWELSASPSSRPINSTALESILKALTIHHNENLANSWLEQIQKENFCDTDIRSWNVENVMRWLFTSAKRLRPYCFFLLTLQRSSTLPFMKPTDTAYQFALEACYTVRNFVKSQEIVSYYIKRENHPYFKSLRHLDSIPSATFPQPGEWSQDPLGIKPMCIVLYTAMRIEGNILPALRIAQAFGYLPWPIHDNWQYEEEVQSKSAQYERFWTVKLASALHQCLQKMKTLSQSEELGDLDSYIKPLEKFEKKHGRQASDEISSSHPSLAVETARTRRKERRNLLLRGIPAAGGLALIKKPLAPMSMKNGMYMATTRG